MEHTARDWPLQCAPIALSEPIRSPLGPVWLHHALLAMVEPTQRLSGPVHLVYALHVLWGHIIWALDRLRACSALLELIPPLPLQ